MVRKRTFINVENLKGFGECSTCKGIYKAGDDYNDHVCVLPREVSHSPFFRFRKY